MKRLLRVMWWTILFAVCGTVWLAYAAAVVIGVVVFWLYVAGTVR